MGDRTVIEQKAPAEEHDGVVLAIIQKSEIIKR